MGSKRFTGGCAPCYLALWQHRAELPTRCGKSSRLSSYGAESAQFGDGNLLRQPRIYSALWP
jgi:hypothetical protein